jgi:hypothetical protein
MNDFSQLRDSLLSPLRNDESNRHNPALDIGDCLFHRRLLHRPRLS